MLSLNKHNNKKKMNKKAETILEIKKEEINKYDSDEESQKNESDSESEKEKEIENEIEKISQEKKVKSELFDSSQLIGNFINTLSKEKKCLYEINNLNFYDEDLIKKINSDNIKEEENLNNILLELNHEMIFDEVDKVIFYSDFFTFILKKMFILIKKHSINDEIINLFDLINKISAQILKNILEFINNNNKAKTYINDLKKIKLITLQIIDYVIELYFLILSVRFLIQPDLFLSISLKYLINYLCNNNNNNNINHEELTTGEQIFIKKYLETLHQIISNRKLYNINFSIEQYKDLFTVCFFCLNHSELCNIGIIISEIIILILDLLEDNFFNEKFIENFLLCFDTFLNKFNYYSENFKFYNIDKKIYDNYLNFFNEYRCINSKNISIFTYLFLKFNSLNYINDKFIEGFHNFIQKIFEWNKNQICLILYCIIIDLLKIKYNIEFCIVQPLITNFYLSILNLCNGVNIDINIKKFLMNVLQIFFNDLLTDFELMKDCYLCFGKENKILFEEFLENKKENNSELNINKKRNKKKKQSIIYNEKECECFSCSFTKINKENSFNCQKCHYKTNLRLQLIDPEKDDNLSVCGFCNMKSFFESCGIIFEKENEMTLIDIDEEIIKELSKRRLKNDIEKEDDKITIFEKFLLYQNLLYKKAFLFLKINLLKFIRISNSIDNENVNNNIQKSFQIFLKILINDNKMKNATYNNFSNNLLQFYKVQKERTYNLHQDIYIDDKTIQYFFFFHFYVNLLFTGHIKIIDMIFYEKHNWNIKHKSMKILENFIQFEKKETIFQSFQVILIAPLLCDSSLVVREYAFNLLFKLYQNKKIDREQLIRILYENINESSFLIRKRIVKALSNLILIENERENLPGIIAIFLNKLNDTSESEKLKKYIYEFFINAFKQKSNNYSLLKEILSIFINILIEMNEIAEGSTLISENISKLFEKINLDLKNTQYEIMISFLMENYLFIEKNVNVISNKELTNIIQALTILKIISKYDSENTSIYIEDICNYFSQNSPIKSIRKSDKSKDSNRVFNEKSNQIIQLSCEILSNIFTYYDKGENNNNVKNNLINQIENDLIYVIINRPSFVMISALETYFKLINRGLVFMDKIQNLVVQNFNFLLNIKINFLNNNEISFPENIISKSISLLSYIIYSIKEDQIIEFFQSDNLKEITEKIFDLLSFYTTSYSKSFQINLRAFESFGFFWIKFPNYLSKSSKCIQYIIDNIKDQNEKIILLKTFYNFFQKISILTSQKQKEKLEQIEKKENLNDKEFDFGVIHIFFEKFIDSISHFMLNDNSILIRLYTIRLLQLIVNLGNLNVHKILPEIFPSLFDINSEIRYIASTLLEKILKMSNQKFFNLLNECLINSYNFQKNIFSSSQLINSFIKVEDKDNLNKYVNSNENVFELFCYRLTKLNIKSSTKNFLNKFLEVFNNINVIENYFISGKNSLKDCIYKFEFYEFIAKLIGDFKFEKRNQIFLIFDSMYIDYETNLCVFKSKLKNYKSDENINQMDMKLIYYFLITGLKTFLLKFLAIKYKIFSEEDMYLISIKGWLSYKNYLAEKDVKIENKIEINNEFKNVPFFQFYLVFEKICQIVFNSQMKKMKKFKPSDKQIIVDYLSLLKSFANNYSLSEISDTITRKKRKLRRSLQDAFLLSYFIPNENSDKSDSKPKLFINEKTNFKYRNRITLGDIKLKNDYNKKSVNDNIDEIISTSEKSYISENKAFDIEVEKENNYNSNNKEKKKNKKCKDTSMKNYKKRKTKGILIDIIEESD